MSWELINMSEGPVVNSAVAAILIFSVSIAEAARKKAPQQRAASPKATAPRTVGEVVNLSTAALQKSQTALPAFSQSLFSQPVVSRSQVDLSRVKPPSSQEFFKGDSDKAELERATNQQIEELYKLTQRFKNSPRRGELWLRLAELYVEKASLIQMRLQEDYDQRVKEFIDKRSKQKPKLNLAASLEYNRRAIQLYEWFARDFSRDPKMDQALFFLGYNHYELNNTKKGTEFYTRLVRQYPRSSFVTESHFALAEFYFENEKWTLAHDNYQKVVASRGHRLALFSLYKMGWSSYRAGQNQRALKELEQVILQARGGGDKTKVENEAARDLILVYAEVGRPSQAISYLREWTRDRADWSIERLAYLYSDRGNREGARQLFTYLINRDPTAEKAFEYKYQIVRSYSTSMNTQEFKTEFLSWIRDYSDGSRWHEANRGKKDVIENAERTRESTLRTWILQQHQAAQKTRSRTAQLLAAEGYSLYVSQFRNAPQLGDMHFYYGEVLYDLGRYDDAANQYRWVVENAPQNRFAAKAAENVVIAMEKTLPKDAEIAKRVGKSLEAVPFSKESQNFVATAQWFAQKFPNHPKNLEILFRMGRLHYQHNQFDQAIPYFQQVVRRDPKSKPAEFSANLLLDIFNLKKDYAGLEQVGSELLQIPAFQGTKASREIESIISKARFKKIQDQEGRTDPATLAQQYEDFGRKNLNTGDGTTALFNAALTYEKAGRHDRALDLHALVLKSPGDKALKSRSRKIIAQLYQDAGQLEEAAASYRAAALDDEGSAESANFHYNAALLYEALNRPKEAIENYEAFFRKSKSAERSEALWQMAEIAREQGQLSRAVDAYKSYLGFPRVATARKIETSFHIAELSEKLNRASDADRFRKQTLQWQKEAAPNKKGVGAQFAAQIRLAQIRGKEREFRNLTIPKDPNKQAKVVQNKIALMNRLNDELAEVIQYDSADEIVGALLILASANHHMYEALIHAPLPPGLSGENLQAYKSGVAQVAEPFRQKAKDSLKVGLERAKELEVYGSEFHRLENLTKEISPELAASSYEVGFETNFVHWMGL